MNDEDNVPAVPGGEEAARLKRMADDTEEVNALLRLARAKLRAGNTKPAESIQPRGYKEELKGDPADKAETARNFGGL